MRFIRNAFYRFPAFGKGIAAIFVVGAVERANAANLPTNVISNTSQVEQLFCVALLWMFWGLIIVAIAMFLVGGYYYATSGGDVEKVTKANKTLLYAVIAVVVALIAKGMPLLIGNLLGVPASDLSVCG